MRVVRGVKLMTDLLERLQPARVAAMRQSRRGRLVKAGPASKNIFFSTATKRNNATITRNVVE